MEKGRVSYLLKSLVRRLPLLLAVLFIVFGLVTLSVQEFPRIPSLEVLLDKNQVETPTPDDVTPEPTPIVPQAPAGEKANLEETHIVQAGESSWGLAEQYLGDGSRYPEIEQLNQLSHNQRLAVGMELKIPTQVTDDQESVAEGKPTVPPLAPPFSELEELAPPDLAFEKLEIVNEEPVQTYQVQAGDSLWKIAQAKLGSGYAWSELYKANQRQIGANPGMIYPGMILELPSKTLATK